MQKKDEPAASFEASLQRLETIVAEMESGQLDLDKMIAVFEEGQKLVKRCTEKLNEVEKRIEKMVQTEDGNVIVEPFDPATARQSAP